MLRKFLLVGLVVLTGRGSVAQVVCGTVLSFFFFAALVKLWPMKNSEDNMLRASAELHIFWTIMTTFVLKSDFKHEKIPKDFYGGVLLVTFVICLPCALCLAVWSKFQRSERTSRLRPVASTSDLPQREFLRYKAGLASADDRVALKAYFDTRTSHYSLLELFDELANAETGLLELDRLSERVRDGGDALIEDTLQRVAPDLAGNRTSTYVQQLQQQVSSPTMSFDEFLTWHLGAHTPVPDAGTPSPIYRSAAQLGGAEVGMIRPSRSSLTEHLLGANVSQSPADIELTGLNSESEPELQPQP